VKLIWHGREAQYRLILTKFSPRELKGVGVGAPKIQNGPNLQFLFIYGATQCAHDS